MGSYYQDCFVRSPVDQTAFLPQVTLWCKRLAGAEGSAIKRVRIKGLAKQLVDAKPGYRCDRFIASTLK